MQFYSNNSNTYEYNPGYEAPEEQGKRGGEKSKDLGDLQYTALRVAFGHRGFVKEGFSLSYGYAVAGHLTSP